MRAPYIDDGDVVLRHGDCVEVMREMDAGSVDCCVTSPPYFGLRDYGVDGQIGLEDTPAAYVARLVEVFAEVRRVLADYGTCWVVLGDSYAGYWGDKNASKEGRRSSADTNGLVNGFHMNARPSFHDAFDGSGVKPKDLLMMPARVALALQADGWWLRSDIIWAKPNPMPESIRDRPTSAHEHILLLTKAPRYWYDAEAIQEATKTGPGATWEERKAGGATAGNMIIGHEKRNGTQRVVHGEGVTSNLTRQDGMRNARNVWTIATQPTPEAHFATFPRELVRLCLAAGCPTKVCRECGEPSTRIVEREIAPREVFSSRSAPDDGFFGTGQSGIGGEHFGKGQKLQKWRDEHPSQTIGWTDCGHDAYRPGRVLDPFMGSGTTAIVARTMELHAVGIELNAEYLEIAARRLQQLSLLGGGD